MIQSLFDKMIAHQNDCFVVLVRASALAKMIVRQNDWRVRLITVLDCLAHKWMGVAWTHVYGERFHYVCQRYLIVNPVYYQVYGIDNLCKLYCRFSTSNDRNAPSLWLQFEKLRHNKTSQISCDSTARLVLNPQINSGVEHWVAQ